MYMELEYNIVFLSLLSIGVNSAIFLTGYFSKNKYALLGSIRTLIVLFGLDWVDALSKFSLFLLVLKFWS